MYQDNRNTERWNNKKKKKKKKKKDEKIGAYEKYLRSKYTKLIN